MEMFVLIIACILALDVAGKLRMLYTRNFDRKASTVALDTAANVGLLVWAVWVLARP